jgi:hypothetical protein
VLFGDHTTSGVVSASSWIVPPMSTPALNSSASSSAFVAEVRDRAVRLPDAFFPVTAAPPCSLARRKPYAKQAWLRANGDVLVLFAEPSASTPASHPRLAICCSTESVPVVSLVSVPHSVSRSSVHRNSAPSSSSLVPDHVSLRFAPSAANAGLVASQSIDAPPLLICPAMPLVRTKDSQVLGVVADSPCHQELVPSNTPSAKVAYALVSP